MNPLIRFKKPTPIILALAFAFFGLSPSVHAVSPPPDGGYPGGNTAEGQAALLRLTTGQSNTAVGNQALRNVTTASHNTAIGAGALFRNIADQITATGYGALLNNTTGELNTADGTLALFSNTTGCCSTAIGWNALTRNTTGNGNTAIGPEALLNNRTGNANTALGPEALESNTTGSSNTATGWDALVINSTGSNNTATGLEALYRNTTGSNNTALGYKAGSNLSTGNNNIDIGYNVLGVQGESNTIRIGNPNITDTLISGIYHQTLFVGLPVFIMPNGILGTSSSSKRFKEEIKAMDKASEALYSLKPVTFRYKKKIDPLGTRQFGLVAEDVEEVNPDLVVHDENGKVDSVRYDQVNAMLLNEFLKEHRKVEQLTKDFESKLAEQQKQIQQLTAGFQKVSAQLELSKLAPQTVLNDQ